jgi:Calx-beta domain
MLFFAARTRRNASRPRLSAKAHGTRRLPGCGVHAPGRTMPRTSWLLLLLAIAVILPAATPAVAQRLEISPSSFSYSISEDEVPREGQPYLDLERFEVELYNPGPSTLELDANSFRFGPNGGTATGLSMAANAAGVNGTVIYAGPGYTEIGGGVLQVTPGATPGSIRLEACIRVNTGFTQYCHDIQGSIDIRPEEPNPNRLEVYINSRLVSDGHSIDLGGVDFLDPVILTIINRHAGDIRVTRVDADVDLAYELDFGLLSPLTATLGPDESLELAGTWKSPNPRPEVVGVQLSIRFLNPNDFTSGTVFGAGAIFDLQVDCQDPEIECGPVLSLRDEEFQPVSGTFEHYVTPGEINLLPFLVANVGDAPFTLSSAAVEFVAPPDPDPLCSVFEQPEAGEIAALSGPEGARPFTLAFDGTDFDGKEHRCRVRASSNITGATDSFVLILKSLEDLRFRVRVLNTDLVTPTIDVSEVIGNAIAELPFPIDIELIADTTYPSDVTIVAIDLAYARGGDHLVAPWSDPINLPNTIRNGETLDGTIHIIGDGSGVDITGPFSLVVTITFQHYGLNPPAPLRDFSFSIDGEIGDVFNGGDFIVPTCSDPNLEPCVRQYCEDTFDILSVLGLGEHTVDCLQDAVDLVACFRGGWVGAVICAVAVVETLECVDDLPDEMASLIASYMGTPIGDLYACTCDNYGAFCGGGPDPSWIGHSIDGLTPWDRAEVMAGCQAIPCSFNECPPYLINEVAPVTGRETPDPFFLACPTDAAYTINVLRVDGPGGTRSCPSPSVTSQLHNGDRVFVPFDCRCTSADCKWVYVDAVGTAQGLVAGESIQVLLAPLTDPWPVPVVKATVTKDGGFHFEEQVPSAGGEYDGDYTVSIDPAITHCQVSKGDPLIGEEPVVVAHLVCDPDALPAVEMLKPSEDGERLIPTRRGIVDLQAQITNDAEVSQVHFRVDGSTLGFGEPLGSGRYVYFWDFANSGVDYGPHLFDAVAVGDIGQSRSTEKVEGIVHCGDPSNSAPKVSVDPLPAVLSLASGQQVLISGEATSDAKWASLRVNGTPAGRFAFLPGQGRFQIGWVPPELLREYEFQVEVVDDCGNVARSEPFRIRLLNGLCQILDPAPTPDIQFILPIENASGATQVEPDAAGNYRVIVEATSDDVIDYPILVVELYALEFSGPAGGPVLELIGRNSNPGGVGNNQYSFAWLDVPTGPSTLHAVAYTGCSFSETDQDVVNLDGGSTTGASVRVTVDGQVVPDGSSTYFVDYGVVGLGEQRVKTYTISNLSSETLTFGSGAAEIDGSEFQFLVDEETSPPSEFPASIPAGGSANFSIATSSSAPPAGLVRREVRIDLPPGSTDPLFSFDVGAYFSALPSVTISASDPSATEAADTGTYRVTRSGPSGLPLTVPFAVSGDASSSDFALSSSSPLTIPAGSSGVNLTLTALADNVIEGPEDVVVTLASDPSRYLLEDPASATVTITDSLLGVPEVWIAVTDEYGSEPSGDDAEFTVNRTNVDIGDGLLVYYDVSGDATPGADYQELPGSVTIPPNQYSATVRVRVFDDLFEEEMQSVRLDLREDASTFYSLGAPSNAKVYIVDDDSPAEVTITASDATATEPGPGVAADPGTLRIARTGGNPSAALQVHFRSVTGPGLASNSAYTLSASSPLTIPGGASYAEVTVTPLENLVLDGPRTARFEVYAPAGSGYTAGSPSQADVTIQDAPGGGGGAPTVHVDRINDAAEPSTVGAFEISRTDQNLQDLLKVYFTLSGDAVEGTDYVSLGGSVTIPPNERSTTLYVSPLDDFEVEGTETITAKLSPSSSGLYSVGSPSQATLSLFDNDSPAEVTITASDATATEPGPGVAADPGTLRIQRTGGNPSAALQVHFRAVTGPGLASNSEYELSKTSPLTIAGGAAYAEVTVTPLSDLVLDGPEPARFEVYAPAGSGYTVGSPSQAEVTIQDAPNGGGAATVRVERINDAAEPGTSGAFQISRTGGNLEDLLKVYFTVSGDAVAGTDYTSLGSSVTIPSNAMATTLQVSPIDDFAVEGTEAVTVRLGPSPTGQYSVGSESEATLSLFDNDSPAEVTITASDGTATEPGPGVAADTATLRIQRTGGSAALQVSFRAVTGPGLASNSEYELSASSPLTIPGGASYAEVTLTPLSDLVLDGPETARFEVYAPTGSGYGVGSPSQADVTIQDAPGGVQSVRVERINDAAEPSTAGVFEISRTDQDLQDLLKVYFTVSGDAAPGTDYVSLGSSAVIPAGQRSKTIYVQPIDDSLPESPERVELTLEPPPPGPNALYQVDGSMASAVVTITSNE